MRVKAYRNFDGIYGWSASCSNDCDSASLAYELEQSRMKKEVAEANRNTPIRRYRKTMRSFNKLWKSLTGTEDKIPKDGNEAIDQIRASRDFRRMIVTELNTDGLGHGMLIQLHNDLVNTRDMLDDTSRIFDKVLESKK